MLKNLKIGTRLLAGFAGTLIVLLVISVTGMLFLQKVADAGSQMYQKDTIGISSLGSYQYSFMTLRLQSYITIYADSTSPADQAAALKKLYDTNFADMDKFLEEFKGTVRTQEDEKIFNGLQTLHNQYKEAFLNVIDATAANNTEQMTANISVNAAISTELNTKLIETVDYCENHAKLSDESNAGSRQTSTVVTLTLTILGIGISVFLALLITKNITKPINKLVAGADKLANGDIDIKLDESRTDEIGILSKSFGRVTAAINALTGDLGVLVDSAKKGDLKKRADAGQHKGEYRKIVEGFNGMLDVITEPLDEFKHIQDRMCVNDFTQTVTGSYEGTFAEMADNYNKLIHQMQSIANALKTVSVGDFSLLPSFEKAGKRSENDEMMPSATKMMQTVNALVNEANLLSDAIKDGNLDLRGDEMKFEGRYREAINGMNGIMESLSRPLNEAMGVLGAMARHDLTTGMTGEYKGTFSNLSQSINSMIDTLNQILSDINAAAEQVAAGTQQVSAGSQALSQGATEQASATEELTASLSEIADQTRQNAVNANQASDLATSAKDDAMAGDTRMKELQQAMNEINEASASISKIIKVIDDIAFQTNLLALNAAVEAARAGQHGKGFAVVAEEVRNLAQRSAGAAKETTTMIEESIKKVKAGTKIANDTADALNRIVDSVEKATGLVGGIAKASGDQASAVAQVNSGIEQVSQVTQTNSATAEESAAASEELSSQAEILKDMVGKFTLKGHAYADTRKPSHGAERRAPAIPEAKPSAAKPKIALNDGEFGKY